MGELTLGHASVSRSSSHSSHPRLLFLFIVYVYYVICSNAKTARKEGDIILGALFPIHRAPRNQNVYTRTCGPIWEQYGIHRTEIFIKTIEEINNNSQILPNVTVGYDIRDSCWYSPVALEQSIDFIKDSLASLEEAKGPGDNDTDTCKNDNKQPIVGLIGPGSSQNTIQVQNLLQIFNLPQIGFSATSMELSDKNLYKYFMRVVPSDINQAKAMLDIVLRYNWTYISTVHSDGSYGAKGMESFERLVKNSSICIANSESVAPSAGDEDYDVIIKNMLQTENARVIVCFCEGTTVNRLYKATLRNKRALRHFLILGSDGWADRPDVVEDIQHVVTGGMSIKLYSPPIVEFDDFFQQLDPFVQKHNPWFTEFWEEKYQCTFDVKNSTTPPCTGKETDPDFVQDSKLGFVINAIYTMVVALHNMHQVLCGGVPGTCDQMFPIKGNIYLDYLMNVNMTTYSADELFFDKHGDPPARYDIMNFQKFVDEMGNITYKYVRVGAWRSGQLHLNDSEIYWPSIGRDSTFTSVCSEPCKIGYVKNIDRNSKCCWSCMPCEDNEYMVDDETCKPCALGWWPNQDLTACVKLRVEYLSWIDTESLVAVSLACFGIFVTLWLYVIFLRHHNTPVVKASTRELSYIIMIGIIIAYSCNFVLVAKPTMITCYFARILPGLSFSLIYGALFTKTNRIARILEGTKKIITKKPRFMSASAQVIITFILVGIECAIITVMLIIEPADSKLDYPSNRRVRLVCNTTPLGIVVPFGFDLVLIIMCTLYAVKTRNLPENFNEAKFIGFTMYTTCVIWLGFFAIYFGSEARVLTMSISISLSASVALVLLFFPKVYVIVWAPEKNTRSAFTTSKDVRCHIGSISFHSADSVDLARDKKMDKSIHRRRTLFGRSRIQKQKDNSANRRQSMSLPPNMKLNRQNSTHVPRTTNNSKNNQSFPWKTIDRSPTEDHEDRLSTISSREESHGSEKRKNGGIKKTDSECQTETEMFEEYINQVKARNVGSLRRRHVNHVTNTTTSTNPNATASTSSPPTKQPEVKRESSSDSSINSDEIFLTLPTGGAKNPQSVYRTSPKVPDKLVTTATGLTPTTDHSIQSTSCLNNLSTSAYKCDLHPSCVVVPNHVQQNHSNVLQLPVNRNMAASPMHQPFVHPSGNIGFNPGFLPPLHTYPFAGITPWPNECAGNAISSLDSAHAQSNQHSFHMNPVFQLREDQSGLYSRRHGNKHADVSKHPFDSDDHMDTQDSIKPSLSFHSNTSLGPSPSHRPSGTQAPRVRGIPIGQGLIDDHSPSCGTNRLIRGEISDGPSSLRNHQSAFRKSPRCREGRREDDEPLVDVRKSSSPSDDDRAIVNQIDPERVSMISFHNYLKNHGVDLDMNNVQSSDV